MLRLTNLLLVEEKLLEAEHFSRRLSGQRDVQKAHFELNAFLSAARSVTFLIQKELTHIIGFKEWWAEKRATLRSDEAARFFLEMRNFSQKAGRVSLVSTSSGRGIRKRWVHCFAGTSERVPDVLLHRDVADCCREHLRKLAALVIECTERFPYHTCSRRALTEDGVKALGIAIADIEEAVGYPRGWTASPEFALADQLRVLAHHVDGVDFEALRRLSRLRSRRPVKLDTPSAVLQDRLRHSLVEKLEGRRNEARIDDPMLDVLTQDLQSKNKR